VRPDRNGYRIGVENWLEPDVSVTWPDQVVEDGYFVGSPMIAVEVLSPGEEIDQKLALYLDSGAKKRQAATRAARCARAKKRSGSSTIGR
jgi:hypothetical protein